MGKRVKLTIEEFDIEPAQSSDNACLYDHLTVYGGPDRASPQLTQLCSKQTDKTEVTSQGRAMLVAFYSDGSIRGKGFTASYTSSNGGCGGRMIGKFE